MSELKPIGREKVISTDKIEAFERKMAKSTKVHHDLFVLDITDTRKNMSYEEDEQLANWVKVPHKHFYHTVSSDGKPLANSAPSNGHFHPVEVTEDENGKITGVKCGPPKVMHKGKAHGYRNDNHTHEISYLASEIVERRVSNSDAQKVMIASRSDETNAMNGAKGIVK